MKNAKVAKRTAVICYGLGDLASQFVWSFVGSYLTIFYMDVVGLAPVVISAIMMGARIWDAVNDPIMGAIAERTRSKFGRFRPYIAFGCVPLAVFSVLTFTHPFSGDSAAGVIWATVTYIIAGMLFTLVNIPYGALVSVMTEDSNQRNQINSSRNIGMQIGRLVVNAFSAAILLKFSAENAAAADSTGYFITALIYAIISIPMYLAVFFTSKENIMPAREEIHKFSFKETFLNLVKNKYLMIVTLITVLSMTFFMGRMSVLSFYVTYCLGDMGLMAVITTIPSVMGIIVSFFIPSLVKITGKRNLLMLSMAVQGISLLIIYMAPFDNIPMVIAGCFIFGIFSMSMPLSLSMVADSIDYMELKTGVRTDGTAYATYGLATKLGNAIGGAVGVVILGAMGYVANAQQTEETLRGINITVNLIPAIICFLAAAACLLWRMTDKEADHIREQIKARKQ